MNVYGLRTDQLSSYWISNHGKRLKAGDDRVAVCIDCHGVHDVLRSDNPKSRTHFQKVPETCGTCHSNVDLMAEYHLSPLVVDQYKRSVHGRNVLEKGDAGSPNCATCHGNHAAAPPGYLEVGHVCGKCHKQIEDYFLASVHGRIPVMARCIGCHGKDGHRSNHEIEEASPALEQVVQAYEKLPEGRGAASTDTRQRFDEAVKRLSGSVRLDTVCTNCHGKAKSDPHAIFFEKTDREALETGQTLARLLADSQFEYARTAAKVAALERGVLLLRDEKLRVEDVKTETMVLYATIHTLNVKEIEERAKKITQSCKEIEASLSQKEAGLTKRRMVLAGMWVFGAVFCVLMYQKYLQLKRQYVTVHADGTPRPYGPALSRRRWLDGVVGVMGAITGIGLLWPAVAYVLPARKRGGGTERVSAGKEADWAVWDVRKVSFRGKPAAVIRTSEGFKAFSAVCTHLGCIVHWDSKGKQFQCPCHAATFDVAGQVVSGPPPKPLPEFAVQVVSGEVFVAPSAQG